MKKFCVVGESGPVTGLRRTWFQTEDDAVAHAKALVRQQFHRQSKPLGLYVVEIKKAVAIAVPAIEVRDVTDEDLIELA